MGWEGREGGVRSGGVATGCPRLPEPAGARGLPRRLCPGCCPAAAGPAPLRAPCAPPARPGRSSPPCPSREARGAARPLRAPCAPRPPPGTARPGPGLGPGPRPAWGQPSAAGGGSAPLPGGSKFLRGGDPGAAPQRSVPGKVALPAPPCCRPPRVPSSGTPSARQPSPWYQILSLSSIASLSFIYFFFSPLPSYKNRLFIGTHHCFFAVLETEVS